MADNSSNPPCRRDDALAVLQILRNSSQTAYFAGGCVRDLLLGMEPKDYDVATDAPPERVRQIFPRTQSVGAAFGVMLVRQGQSVIEVATFRSDLSYADGRRPEGVRFSTPEEDARRRDFTINGLFLDPTTDQVIDFVDGQSDLQNRILRAIGKPEERFAEDHLRLLRAVRFAARFGLSIDAATADAIAVNGPKLIRISPERIADELRMMLTPPTRCRALQLLWAFDLPRVILRDLPEKVSAAWNASPLLSLYAEENISFGLALTLFVLDYRLQSSSSRGVMQWLEEPAVRQSVRACRKDLKISNDEAETMWKCMELAFLLRGEEPGVATMKRFLARPNSREAQAILAAVAETEPAWLPRINWLLARFAELNQSEIAPTPLISGEDLLAAGLIAGPAFKQILHDVYDAQLENKISTREEAMQLAMKIDNEK